MFTLKTKGKLEFTKPFKTEKELDQHINTLFHNRKGMQPRDSIFTLKDFMKDREKVFLSISSCGVSGPLPEAKEELTSQQVEQIEAAVGPSPKDRNAYHNWAMELNGVASAVLLLQKHGATVSFEEQVEQTV